MEDRYIPSEELVRIAIEKSTPAYRKLVNELLDPANDLLIAFKAEELGISPDEIRRDLASGLTKNGINSKTISSVQESLAYNLTGAIEMLCFRNVAFEHSGLEERIKFHKEHGSPQVPENPKISIISDSREGFNPIVYGLLKQAIPFEDSDSFLKCWNNDFYDFVSRNAPVRQNPKGILYLENGKVYFKTEVSLPPKTPAGGAIVVGGVIKKTIRIRRNV